MADFTRLTSSDPDILAKAVDAIGKDGFVSISNFISAEQCRDLLELLEGQQLRNSNDLTFVQVQDARFFSNAVAQSKAAYDLVTNQTAIDISKRYLSNHVRLKCHRAYSMRKRYFFPWHTDNKFDAGKNNPDSTSKCIN